MTILREQIHYKSPTPQNQLYFTSKGFNFINTL